MKIRIPTPTSPIPPPPSTLPTMPTTPNTLINPPSLLPFPMDSLYFLLFLSYSSTFPLPHIITPHLFFTNIFIQVSSFSLSSLFLPRSSFSSLLPIQGDLVYGWFHFASKSMFGGNNSNTVFPFSFGEHHFHGKANALPQLQLFGENQAGCIGGPLNHIGNEHTIIVERAAKRGRESETVCGQQMRRISLNTNCQQYESGQLGTILNPNPVSIGLKLSNEEEEHNSSITYAIYHKAAVSPMLAIANSLKVEIDRQQEEFDHQIRLQEDNMRKVMRELGEKQALSFLSAIETGIGRKLQEKEVEIQNMSCKNNELVEKIKQISAEVQSWKRRSKYNESVVNALSNNMKQVMAQGVAHGNEGYGDSEVDTAASYASQNVLEANMVSLKRRMICISCKTKEVSILLLPCRHLCLCKDCAGYLDACPKCQVMKTAGIEVYTS